MKTHHSFCLLPATFFTALSLAISADAALVIASNGSNAEISSISTNIKFDGVGGIAMNSNTDRFGATGSVSESGAFGGTIGITLNAMKNVSTAPATLGDQLTPGSFNWNANVMGVQDDPNGGGIGNQLGGSREGITFALNATTGISSAVGFQITAINVQNVGGSGDPVGESFTIVNLLTRQSLVFVPTSGSAGDFDVSSLNLTMAGGNSGPVAAIYSGDVGGFRFAGLTLDTVPEPTSALLVGVSLLAGCFGRRRS